MAPDKHKQRTSRAVATAASGRCTGSMVQMGIPSSDQDGPASLLLLPLSSQRVLLLVSAALLIPDAFKRSGPVLILGAQRQEMSEQTPIGAANLLALTAGSGGAGHIGATDQAHDEGDHVPGNSPPHGGRSAPRFLPCHPRSRYSVSRKGAVHRPNVGLRVPVDAWARAVRIPILTRLAADRRVASAWVVTTTMMMTPPRTARLRCAGAVRRWSLPRPRPTRRPRAQLPLA